MLVWDAEKLDQPQALEGHGTESIVTSARWSPDSKLLAAVTLEGGPLIVWDVATGSTSYESPGDQHIADACWSDDGLGLATAGTDLIVRVWNRIDGEVHELAGHEDEILSVCWSRRWSQHQGRIWDLTWNSAGTQLATASADQTVRIWDLAANKEIFQFTEHKHGVRAVSWSPDGSRIASTAWNTEKPIVKIWSQKTGEVTLELRGHERVVTCIQWSPDGRQIATGSLDLTVRLWDAATGKEISDPKWHTGFVKSLDWSPHQERPRLAVASTNGTVSIWDLETGKLAMTLRMTPRGNSSVRWSPDGTRLAAVVGETVKIWDASVGYRSEE